MYTRRSLTEGKVQGLGREVPDDVGGVTSPEGEETLVTVGTAKAVTDALVGLSETALLDLHAKDTTMSIGGRRNRIGSRRTISSWFCTKSLIRSMGAAEVFATA